MQHIALVLFAAMFFKTNFLRLMLSSSEMLPLLFCQNRISMSEMSLLFSPLSLMPSLPSFRHLLL